MLEKVAESSDINRAGVIYFRCADIALTVQELSGRGVIFDTKPHLIAQMDDHDLWMAFFKNPDGAYACGDARGAEGLQAGN